MLLPWGGMAARSHSNPLDRVPRSFLHFCRGQGRRVSPVRWRVGPGVQLPSAVWVHLVVVPLFGEGFCRVLCACRHCYLGKIYIRRKVREYVVAANPWDVFC